MKDLDAWFEDKKKNFNGINDFCNECIHKDGCPYKNECLYDCMDFESEDEEGR